METVENFFVNTQFKTMKSFIPRWEFNFVVRRFASSMVFFAEMPGENGGKQKRHGTRSNGA